MTVLAAALDFPPFDLRAVCTGMDPETFFPVSKSEPVPEEARIACGRCVWREPCLRWALEHTDSGVWAGTNTAEREQLRRDLGIAARAHRYDVGAIDPAPGSTPTTPDQEETAMSPAPTASPLTPVSSRLALAYVAISDRLTIVKRLAAPGVQPEDVAERLGLPTDVVEGIGQEYGWPDRDRLGYAVDELQAEADRRAGPRSTPQPVPVAPPSPAAAAPRRAAPAAPAPAPTSPRPLAAPSSHDVTGLLARADKVPERSLGAASVRNAARRVRRALVVLEESRTALTTALAAIEAQRQADAERAAKEAKARSDIARLEAELAAARATLTGKPASTRPRSTSDREAARAIRQWAAENGVACPARGRVPSRVRDAYLAAQAAA